MKRPTIRKPNEMLEAEVIASGETPPADGFTEMVSEDITTEEEEDESTDSSLTRGNTAHVNYFDESPVQSIVDEDPLPSVPVDEVVTEIPSTMLPFLGTIVPQGMRGKHGGTLVASVPVIVYINDRMSGVMAISDPGMFDAVVPNITARGYTGVTAVYANAADKATKLAAGYSIACQKNVEYLDVAGCLMALGLSTTLFSK